MLNRWLIDNIDIYDKYNLGIVKDGFNDLFLFPSLVPPYINDWHEQNGIEADLENPTLNNKNVNISFASSGKDNILVDSFLSDITKAGYHTLEIKSLGRTFKLRPSLESNRTVYKNGQTFSIQFVDDFPRGQLFEGSIKQGHGLSCMPKSEYSLDGVRFDEYGIIVEKGRAEVYKLPALKKNLERKISNRDSIIYDAAFVRYQSKDVTLKCALYCDTIERFWSNYMAFFSDLIKQNERQLTIEYANDTYPCFYKSMNNPSFFRGRNYVLLKFDLILTITKFRPLRTYFVWGTEAKEIVITEDNINAIIYE